MHSTNLCADCLLLYSFSPLDNVGLHFGPVLGLSVLANTSVDFRSLCDSLRLLKDVSLGFVSLYRLSTLNKVIIDFVLLYILCTRDYVSLKVLLLCSF